MGSVWEARSAIELGRYGRYRTNLWTYAGVNTFKRGRMEELSSHPTVKPVALVMDAIRDCSKPKSIKTTRGGEWSAVQVKRVIGRA